MYVEGWGGGGLPNDQSRGRRASHAPLGKAIKMTLVCRLWAYCKHMDIRVVRPVESETVKVFLLSQNKTNYRSAVHTWKSENCSIFVMSLNAGLLICELFDKIKGKCHHNCECKNRRVGRLIESDVKNKSCWLICRPINQSCGCGMVHCS